MIKSITLTEAGMTCYKTDGSIITLTAATMPDMDSITKMLMNIQLNGCTEFIGIRVEAVVEILESLGYPTQFTEQGLVIPHKNGPVLVEPLEDMIRHAHVTKNESAITTLINRISGIDRQHSKDDLVKFIKNSSMPVTADGRMVAFKRVNKNHEGNNYDCHSGKVLNNVGCRVAMDIDQVDPDRSRDCSYGLHVASRGYLSGFHGNTLLLILVNPEDVIAVPEYDPRKVRVCKYEIVHEFSGEHMSHIISGEKLNNDVWSVIRPFMDGTASYTIDTIVSPGAENVNQEPAEAEETVPQTSEASDDYYEEVVNTKTDNGKTHAIDTIKKVKAMTKNEQFMEMLALFKSAVHWSDKKSRHADLIVLKRKQKKSWVVLGATEAEAKELDKFSVRVK